VCFAFADELKKARAGMDLERQKIQRDFSTARDGYDRQEVENHLRYIADIVDRLQAEAREQKTLSGAAASRIEEVLEAAEREANALREEANEQASDVRESARLKAEQVLQSASVRGREANRGYETEMNESLRRTHNEAAKAHQRAAGGERRLGQLSQALPPVLNQATQLQTNASSLRKALDATQQDITKLRETLFGSTRD
jgi:cell division septum initiation protein DivIVA